MYDDYEIKPLHIMLQKTSAYVKSCDGQTKWMDFLIQVNNLLKKWNTIWDKVSADIKKEFDSKPEYIKFFLKTKLKSYIDDATDFLDKKITKADSNHTYLAVISLDFCLNKDVFLKECKYIEKEQKSD